MTAKRNLYKKLGNTLIEKGVYFSKHAFGVKPKTVSAQYMEILIGSKTGISKNKIWQADETYYYTDLKTIKDILKYDLTDEREYESEKYDCDDFAATVYSKFRYIFELNTMGMARGIKIVDNTTGKTIGWHRANVFVAWDNSLKVYYLEPQTDYITELTGKEVVIGNRKYILNVIDF